ncbi:hypothetical protein RJ639_003286 [Escallonia herrerae]|uniref:H15 domain-containing protein n=1 Tax=Escallonia herrerae TaxID=1293975 RepID=A0AA88W2P7_9ASTE|nr:hypothetical protein RJ639_003286 [Escallonia herrerae]
MASEDPTNPPPPVFPSLPQYPEMIYAAIEAVDEKNGASKTAIAKHIEATYGNLPAAHSTLLSHHLNKMKQGGQLVFYKNNYARPDPNAPPRRGRGRPPKPKDPAPPGAAVVSPPRPRGRPPKARDPLAAAGPPVSPAKASVSGRKRGRPPKAGKSTAEVTAKTTTAAGGGAPRGRGRPPKVKPQVAAPVGA